MDELRTFLDYLVVPLLAWIWFTDRKVSLLQYEVKSLNAFDKKIDEKLDKIYEVLIEKK
jgi:hypothetical protein